MTARKLPDLRPAMALRAHIEALVEVLVDCVEGGASVSFMHDAARLYERLGWIRVGDVPGYALFPRGGPCGTTSYYRDLAGRPASA